MREALDALHHVTAVCASAQRTVDFYRSLGLNLVKKTVNFDDPGSYHLYFGDELGRPGTLLTFFEWPHAGRGRLGAGTVSSLAMAVPGIEEPRSLEDPDGLRLELRPGDRAELLEVRAFGDPRLYEGLLVGEDSPLHFESGPETGGFVGAGSVHHHAWRMDDDEEQLAWRARLQDRGLHPTHVYDRKYFHSVYFRMADGLLLELATDGPGFAVDEPRQTLGEELALPPWLEPERTQIERTLTPIA